MTGKVGADIRLLYLQYFTGITKPSEKQVGGIWQSFWQDRWTSGRAQQGHWIRTNVMNVAGSLRKQFSFLFPDLRFCGSGCILTPAPSAFTSNPDNYPHAMRRGKRVLLKSGPWLQFQPYQQLHNNFSVTKALITEGVTCSPKQSTDLGFEMCALKTWAMWSPYILIVLAQQKASKSILLCSPSPELLAKQSDFELTSFENAGMVVKL